MGTGEFNVGGNPAMDWHPIQGGVEIFLVASCHGNRDKLRPDGPLGSYADFTLPCLSTKRFCNHLVGVNRCFPRKSRSNKWQGEKHLLDGRCKGSSSKLDIQLKLV